MLKEYNFLFHFPTILFYYDFLRNGPLLVLIILAKILNLIRFSDHVGTLSLLNIISEEHLSFIIINLMIS